MSERGKGSIPTFDLSGHVALVTGGNRGIGLAMATGLAKAGADVAIWGRTRDKNDAAVAALRGLGARAEAWICDVGDERSVVECVAATLERFGHIDSCFANAGTNIAKPFLETSVADWDGVMRTNLVGAFLTFREVLRHMVARGGGGKLIVTASIGTMHGMPRSASYSASKAALCALVRSLAVEFARHDIQANAILPGWVETELTAETVKWRKLYDTVVQRTPARRWGEPDDLEGIAVYLASPASRFHTGDVIRVDGGYAVF